MERCFVSCYDNWIHVQKSDLSELLGASASPGKTEAELRAIIAQSMQHYEDYREQRRVLAQEDGPILFSPPWCASFENSVLWIGGCRPSLFIRLLYSVTGSEMDAHLEEFLRGEQGRLASIGTMGLTSRQLQMVNDLHQRTLRAEDRLSSRQASIQEDVADKPLLPVITKRQQDGASNSFTCASSTVPVNDCNHIDGEVDMAMQTYAEGLRQLVVEADRLRVSTVRTLLTEVLSPRQAVELLIAAKQLHLSLHEIAVKRDHQLGRG